MDAVVCLRIRLRGNSWYNLAVCFVHRQQHAIARLGIDRLWHHLSADLPAIPY